MDTEPGGIIQEPTPPAADGRGGGDFGTDAGGGGAALLNQGGRNRPAVIQKRPPDFGTAPALMEAQPNPERPRRQNPPAVIQERPPMDTEPGGIIQEPTPPRSRWQRGRRLRHRRRRGRRCTSEPGRAKRPRSHPEAPAVRTPRPGADGSAADPGTAPPSESARSHPGAPAGLRYPTRRRWTPTRPRNTHPP